MRINEVRNAYITLLMKKSWNEQLDEIHQLVLDWLDVNEQSPQEDLILKVLNLISRK